MRSNAILNNFRACLKWKIAKFFSVDAVFIIRVKNICASVQKAIQYAYLVLKNQYIQKLEKVILHHNALLCALMKFVMEPTHMNYLEVLLEQKL